MRNDLNELVGKHIIQTFKHEDSIYLELNEGTIVELYPYGDCCSNCYINHLDFSDALDDAIVTKIEDLELVHEDKTDRYDDVVDSWGHRIHTTKGICTIDMRLEHNGYYGGQLEVKVSDELPHNAVRLVDF